MSDVEKLVEKLVTDKKKLLLFLQKLNDPGTVIEKDDSIYVEGKQWKFNSDGELIGIVE